LATKATEFGEIMQNNGHYVVQGHSRSPIWYQSKAHMRFSNSDYTNLPPILHRFQVMAVKFSLATGGSFRFNAVAEGAVIPCK